MPLLSQAISEEQTLFYGWFGGMHSRFDIALICDTFTRGEVSQILDRCKEAVERLERLASYHNSESILRKVYSGGLPHVEELDRILSDCMEKAALTQGYYDPMFRGDGIPDLCGFLKGYAAEEIKSIIIRSDIRNALINAGNSSVTALGSMPGGKGWKVSTAGGETAISLCDTALSVSGRITPGNSHIIDPHTGLPSANRSFVAVSGPDAATAEILSTALFAAPPSERRRIMLNFPDYRKII